LFAIRLRQWTASAGALVNDTKQAYHYVTTTSAQQQLNDFTFWFSSPQTWVDFGTGYIIGRTVTPGGGKGSNLVKVEKSVARSEGSAMSEVGATGPELETVFSNDITLRTAAEEFALRTDAYRPSAGWQNANRLIKSNNPTFDL